MKKLSETLLRTLAVFIGLVVEGCASVFMIRADVGAGAWTTITQGFSIQTGYTIGQMTTIVGLFTLAADLLLGEKIGIGTLLDTFVYGMTYDVFDRLLVTPENPPFAYGYILLILGIVTEIIGLAICLHGRLSFGPRDMFSIGMSKKIPKLTVGKVNLIVNVVFVFVGWLLGATVGIGTIVFIVLYAPIMDGIFALLRFDPRDVKQESVCETFESLKTAFSSKA